MKRNNLWQTFIFNWPAKVISLVMAVLLYLVVTFMTVQQREIDIPLQVVLPTSYIATSTIPENVKVIISGEDRAIHMIDPTSIEASVDFTFVSKEGVSAAPIVLSHADYPLTSEITIRVSPEQLRVFFVTSPTRVDGEFEIQDSHENRL